MWHFLLAALLMSPAHAESIRVDYLDTNKEVNENYCRTDPRNSYGECANVPYRIALVYFPLEAGDWISKNLAVAWTRGYFDNLSIQDLFHGHIIHRGPELNFENPEAYFSAISAVLYHSSERLPRWGQEGRAGIPIQERTPRSFVGWLDGNIDAARDLLKPEVPLTDNYENGGTISQREIVQSVAPPITSLSYGISPSQEHAPRSYLKLCRNEKCSVCETGQGSFVITPEAKGRFRLPNGVAYELYFRCTFEERSK